ncbi:MULTISPECIES: glycosyltransferase [Halococcus]|uniref:Family 2 glycosyl transferase n=1 Tax=Halococcus salifodinae DSM 8989 TaxID=1227456 RepID=M0N683_9EURY|nr:MULTISPECIES: glycosyltransferase [Halococcus]EMA53038.1 family 2 glycosyl transferase [Halococcus salifodinae DSM 8989]
MRERLKKVGLAGFGVCTGLLGWQFVGYPLTMGLLARAKGATDEPPDTDNMSPSDTPFITVIVPSYNESSVVAKRVENLRKQIYPNDRYEVLFVDSGSTDGTADVLRDALDDLGPDDPPMRLVEEGERSGKASAINHGVDQGHGEVVLVTDANSVFAPATIARVAPHFSNPTTGAVAGRLGVLDTGSSLTASNQFYRDLEHMKALGGALLGSVSQFDGELSAWRAGIVRADETSLSEDLDLSIRIHEAGYRITYEPRALVYESEPDTVAEQIASNKRRLIGTIQSLIRHWRYLVVPGDWYRALVFPSRKALPMFSPFLCLGSAVCFVVTLAVAPLAALAAALLVGIAGIGTFGALLAVRDDLLADTLPTAASNDEPDEADGGSGTEENGGVRWLLGIARYVAVIEYTILLAWWDYLTGDYSVRWRKSASDRE